MTLFRCCIIYETKKNNWYN